MNMYEHASRYNSPISLSTMVTIVLTGGTGVMPGGSSKVKSIENVSEDSGMVSSVMTISTQDSVSPGLMTRESALPTKSSFSERIKGEDVSYHRMD